MSTDMRAYKATDPEPIRAYLAENRTKWAEFRAKIKKIGDELGIQTLTMRSSGYGASRGQYATGYVEEDEQAPAKPGFRRDSKTGYMVPSLRGKLGKEWEERLHGIAYEPDNVPGLPGVILGMGYLGSFALLESGDEVFAWLDFPIEDDNREITNIDADLWQPAKLSEFYAAKESRDAEKVDA